LIKKAINNGKKKDNSQLKKEEKNKNKKVELVQKEPEKPKLTELQQYKLD
jgi:hypothetical protein